MPPRAVGAVVLVLAGAACRERSIPATHVGPTSGAATPGGMTATAPPVDLDLSSAERTFITQVNLLNGQPVDAERFGQTFTPEARATLNAGKIEECRMNLHMRRMP